LHTESSFFGTPVAVSHWRVFYCLSKGTW